jgi:hypothetical protein
MKPELTGRSAYALFGVVTVMFVSMVLLGFSLFVLDRSREVTETSQERFRLRSGLCSLINESLRWLSHELEQGRRPKAAENNRPADFEALRVFSLGDAHSGFVAVYDLDYDPQMLEDTPGDPFSLLPPCPLGYMIRATFARQGWSPFTIEAAFRVEPVHIPNSSREYVLHEKPLFWRELRR